MKSPLGLGILVEMWTVWGGISSNIFSPHRGEDIGMNWKTQRLVFKESPHTGESQPFKTKIPIEAFSLKWMRTSMGRVHNVKDITLTSRQAFHRQTVCVDFNAKFQLVKIQINFVYLNNNARLFYFFNTRTYNSKQTMQSNFMIQRLWQHKVI